MQIQQKHPGTHACQELKKNSFKGIDTVQQVQSLTDSSQCC